MASKESGIPKHHSKCYSFYILSQWKLILLFFCNTTRTLMCFPSSFSFFFFIILYIDWNENMSSFLHFCTLMCRSCRLVLISIFYFVCVFLLFFFHFFYFAVYTNIKVTWWRWVVPKLNLNHILWGHIESNIFGLLLFIVYLYVGCIDIYFIKTYM